MNRRLKIGMIGFCIIAAAVFYFLPERQGVQETWFGLVEQSDQEEYKNMMKNRKELSGEERIPVSIYYKEEAIPFDKLTDTFMRFQPMKDSKLTLESEYDEKVHYMRNESDTKMLAYTESSYTEYSFAQASLPVLVLHTDGRQIGEEKYTAVSMTVYDEQSEYGLRNTVEAGIHLRGATSIWLPKKNYRVQVTSSRNNIGKKYPFLGMRAATEWILYSFYGDESKTREKLARDLWDDIAADSSYADRNNGLEMEYCEVYFDNEYMGLYGMGTAMDRRTFWEEKDKERQDLLFKTVSFDVPTLEDIAKVGSDEQCKALELKYASWPSDDMWSTIGEYMNLAYYASDEEYLEKMQDYMVIDNHIDYWLFFLASGLDDNELKNIYFSIEDAQNSTQILMTPWDMDMAWGVGYTGEDEFMWGRNSNQYRKIMPFPIVSRMFELGDQKFIRETQRRWKELRKEIITEERLIKQVNDNYDVIYKSGVLEREKERWPEAKYAYDKEYIENYILKRLPYLDQYMESLGKGEWDDGWE